MKVRIGDRERESGGGGGGGELNKGTMIENKKKVRRRKA